MSQIRECNCYWGFKQQEYNLNNTSDKAEIVYIHANQVSIIVHNNTSTNVSVNIWAEDAEGNGVLTSPDYRVSVPAGSYKCAYIWNFGYQPNSPFLRDRCIVHTRLHNDDNERDCAEVFVEIYSGT